MTVQIDTAATPATTAEQDDTGFDLDITIVEGGAAADQLIRLTVRRVVTARRA
ncbi:hypothetical protein OG594_24130 [Streptomyces sp. NBC_01214]|uniref:hypothetical protein n=1 Tax=Streptomyces sp. NBC_01214 TaxID=2903777 RepID=UPI00225760A0|nr:hypothetical protein [Streptomyces sp. NBC_01214]MCX4804669.1 hypothetical protein [Streptomyces sp. NBC_01214]